mgnify:CR=1 FL=1
MIRTKDDWMSSLTHRCYVLSNVAGLQDGRHGSETFPRRHVLLNPPRLHAFRNLAAKGHHIRCTISRDADSRYVAAERRTTRTNYWPARPRRARGGQPNVEEDRVGTRAVRPRMSSCVAVRGIDANPSMRGSRCIAKWRWPTNCTM